MSMFAILTKKVSLRSWRDGKVEQKSGREASKSCEGWRRDALNLLALGARFSLASRGKAHMQKQ